MMTLPLKIFYSDSHDPWFNLATEDWIFRDMDPKQRVLFLWRNAETVVIGRFQNPWVECNTAKMQADDVKLARRQSGGGAVFQDLGNTNFTFMTGRDSYDKKEHNKIILDALRDFGIEGEASGRNDLVVMSEEGARKFSGSAFKETKDRCFHHGTLLIHANLQKLGDYLSPDAKKLMSKGISSVRSRVVNLGELNPNLNHELLCQSIHQKFEEFYGARASVEWLETSKLTQNTKLNSYYDFLKDWNWRFGETPAFNHHMSERLSFGMMDVHLDSHKGLIEQAIIFSDSLHPEMIEQIRDSLKRRPYTQDGIEQALFEVQEDLPMFAAEINEFANWLKSQIL
jgi:lipoate---protein ligase